MADYKTIKGFTIPSLASDPVPDAGSWASGGNMNTTGSRQGTGSQTAGLAMGGQVPPSTVTANAETYNGTTWTAITAMTTARGQLGAFGASSSSSIAAGGYLGPPGISDLVEEWNGSSWTEKTEINTARRTQNGSGIVTAGLIVGGSDSGSTVDGETEIWNGSTWTEGNDLNTARGWLGGSHVSNTASNVFGGNGPYPSPTNKTEQWDGTSWAETSGMSNSRWLTQGAGSDVLSLCSGGQTPPGSVTAVTEEFDGGSWSEKNDLSTARAECAMGGTQTTAFLAGGQTPSYTNITEEWSRDTTDVVLEKGMVWYNTTTKTLKGYGTLGVGSWAAAATYPTPTERAAYCGTQTEGLITGGTAPPGVQNETKLYNGIVWADSPATLNTARMYLGSTGAGTQTAAIIFGGEAPGMSALTEEFNGTAWTEVNDLNTARKAIVGAGSQSAAQAMTGGEPSAGDKNESWDGTSWTVDTAHPQSKNYAMGGGTQTSAFVCGGDSTRNTSDTWNGTAWTETGDLFYGQAHGTRGAIDATSGIIFGGSQAWGPAPSPPPSGYSSWNKTQGFNGTTWTELGDKASGGIDSAGNGTTIASICVGGGPSWLTDTVEFNCPTIVKTLNSS